MGSSDSWSRLAGQEVFRIETAQTNRWNVLRNVLGQSRFSAFEVEANLAADEALGVLPAQPHAADRILRATFLLKHTQESFPSQEVDAHQPSSEGAPSKPTGSSSPAY